MNSAKQCNLKQKAEKVKETFFRGGKKRMANSRFHMPFDVCQECTPGMDAFEIEHYNCWHVEISSLYFSYAKTEIDLHYIIGTA